MLPGTKGVRNPAKAQASGLRCAEAWFASSRALSPIAPRRRDTTLGPVSVRLRPLLGALAVIGVAAAFLVAIFIGAAPGGHQATAVAWTIQILILFGAILMLAGRAARS